MFGFQEDMCDIDLEHSSTSTCRWWMSEKLDGVRVLWDGEGNLLTRNGNTFSAPDWWKARESARNAIILRS